MNKNSRNHFKLVAFFLLCGGVVLIAHVLRSILLLTFLSYISTALLIISVVFSIVKTDLKIVLIGIGAFCFCLSIITTEWPIRAIFAFSKTQLNNVLEGYSSTQNADFPSWQGLVHVQKIDIRDEGIWLLTRFRFDLSGFVKLSENPDLEEFRVAINLGENWCYLVDD